MYLSASNAFSYAPPSFIVHKTSQHCPAENDDIHSLVRFYHDTPGAEKLLGRIEELGRNLALSLITSVSISKQGVIVAAALGYIHTLHNIYEIGSVLVDPDYKGQGLTQLLRAEHTKLSNGRPTTIFERIDPEKKTALMQTRAIEGWQEIDATHPCYRAVESTKSSNSASIIPKTGMIFAPHGTHLALS